MLLEMQVRSEEERQSGSSSGCVGRLRVHRTACSSDLSCRKSRWPSLGRLLCARFISIEHDAFFSFYRPQMGARRKNGLGGLLPTTATGIAYFWAWDQKPRTARCRMRDRRAVLQMVVGVREHFRSRPGGCFQATKWASKCISLLSVGVSS